MEPDSETLCPAAAGRLPDVSAVGPGRWSTPSVGPAPPSRSRRLRSAGAAATSHDADATDQACIDLSSIPNLSHLASLQVDLVLEGETGCGKDTVARAIHRMQCPDAPFVNVNCAALPEGLIEAELFGAEAGAFTSAMRPRQGKIEAAHGGMLYLDEIDSMPLHLQSKLLQVLQYRGCSRLGSNQFIKSSFRLVASTKTPLKALVDRGQFRADLYFRINVVSLVLPALRDLPHRILPLFERMVQLHAERLRQLPPPPLTPQQQASLLAYAWPGNYRELRACAIRHVCGQWMLDAAPPAAELPRAARTSETTPLRDAVKNYERSLIAQALLQSGGNVAKAATTLRVAPQTLHYRIRALELPLVKPIETTSDRFAQPLVRPTRLTPPGIEDFAS